MALSKLCVFAFLITLPNIACSKVIAHSYRPDKGYVASSQTAKAIAEAVLIPIYGKENIER